MLTGGFFAVRPDGLDLVGEREEIEPKQDGLAAVFHPRGLPGLTSGRCCEDGLAELGILRVRLWNVPAH